MLIGFLVVVLGIDAAIHYYLWRRLVRATTRPGPPRWIGTLLVVALALLVPATLVGTRAGVDWLAWPGFLWLALMFYLLVALVALELPLLVARRWLRRAERVATARAADAAPPPEHRDAAAAGPSTGTGSGSGSGSGRVSEVAVLSAPPAAGGPAADGPPDPDRRLLLARGAAITAGLVATGITGWGVRTALGPPVRNRVQIPLAKLPGGLDGFRIALISDIHLGPLAGRAHTERIVAAVNGLDADVVAVVGDLVDGTVEELGPSAAPLRDLRSRYGAYYVTGNHEYFSGFQPWVDEVARLGMRPLRNARRRITAPGGAIELAGVNDATGGGFGDPPDYDAALRDRDPALPTILLAHQPVQAHEAARRAVDLQLSGHTHGGQMVPFNYVVRLQQPVVSGLGRVDGMPVYVTNGAGFWGPPVRVGAPPQVTLVELRAR